MGKLLHLTLFVMVAFFIISNLWREAYNAAPASSNKAAFANISNGTVYSLIRNPVNQTCGNCSYPNSNNSISRFELLGNNIQTTISENANTLTSDNIVDQLQGAFGLVTGLTINVLLMLLNIPVEAINFIAGLGIGLSLLPPPWNILATLIGLMIALMLIYNVLKLVSAYVKWEI